LTFLDGRDVTLANEAPHHLHGGVHGFNAAMAGRDLQRLEVVGASL
jgi:galactose mutarotase-like enzyme